MHQLFKTSAPIWRASTGTSPLISSKNHELLASEGIAQFPRDDRFDKMVVVKKQNLIFGAEKESLEAPLEG